jgi:hypothetical protein
MGRESDFQEIVGAVFSLIVFMMIGVAMVGALGMSSGFGTLFSSIFGLGVVIIGTALVIQIIKAISDIFN